MWTDRTVPVETPWRLDLNRIIRRTPRAPHRTCSELCTFVKTRTRDLHKEVTFSSWNYGNPTLRYIHKPLQNYFEFFCFLGWGDTESTSNVGYYWPIERASDDKWWWVWSGWWNENYQGKSKYSENTCPDATLFITNNTLLDLGSNPNRRGGKPANNRLSYGTALYLNLVKFYSNIIQ
jgi:hypothetical protein